ncbi:MAG TPA: hypothetical protein VJ999_02310 [Candidatus Sulfotelmatobacter sp.]|nr:hypothetical protein [Candidatus Sulfotelmatobacter sp.]
MSRVLILCVLSFGLLDSAIAQDNVPNPSDTNGGDRISQVKGTLASKLDSALPAIRLEDWLLQQAGTNAKFGWVLRYRPRKEGQPIYDFPDWVEADITLQDGRSISILVGFRAPKQRPYIYSLHVIRDKHEIADLNRLSELTDLLRQSN